MKRNLDHSALPSAEEIQLYQEGKLAPHRAHEIELIAEENPMLGEALEGFSAFPVFDAVPGITAAVSNQAAGIATGTKAAAVASYTGSAWWHLNGWILGLGVGVSAALITVAVTTEDNITSSNETTTFQQPIAQTEQQEVIAEQPVEQDLQLSSEASLADARTSTSVQPTTEVNTASNTARYEVSVGVAQVSPAEPIAAIDIQPVLEKGLLNDELTTVQPLKLENSSLVAVAMVTIQNHRVADYSQLRTRSFEPMKLEDIGLPANYANYDVKQEAQMSDDKVVAVPYLTFVEQCILAFKHEEYKTAIKGFNRILSQYADDINAQFYGAMSYYGNDQPVLALQLFEKAEKNTITSFREEILFYKAKCLKMLNRTDESTRLFEQVISKNGFYRTLAEKELQD
jgi:tetratricopeptide (TPR) repeat protein